VLIEAIENQAIKQNISRIFAEVSITAKPFFKHRGFGMVKEQIVTIHGMDLTNFVMEKNIMN
jgi:putative acetyltransferase